MKPSDHRRGRWAGARPRRLRRLGRARPPPAAGKSADGKTFTMVLGCRPRQPRPAVHLAVDHLAGRRVPLRLAGQPRPDRQAWSPGLAQRWEGTTTTGEVHAAQGRHVSGRHSADRDHGRGEHQLRRRPEERVVPDRRLRPAGRQGHRRRRGRHGHRHAPRRPSRSWSATSAGCTIVCAKGMKDRSLLKQGADGTGMYKLTEAVAGRPLHADPAQGLRVGPGRLQGRPARAAGQGGAQDRRQRDHGGQPADLRPGQHRRSSSGRTGSGWRRSKLFYAQRRRSAGRAVVQPARPGCPARTRPSARR